jgi:hypothetical protein
MKVGVMKLAVAASIILFVLAIVFFGSSASGKNDFYSTSYGLSEFKTKIADAMKNANHDGKNGLDENDVQNGDGLKANAQITGPSFGNALAINSSSINLSATNPAINESSPFALERDSNSTLINQSAENETKSILSAEGSINSGDDSISTGSTFSQNSSVSPAGVHFNNQGAFNGMWSMEASKHGFGRNAINDRIALSGNFDVQKSVSFKG